MIYEIVGVPEILAEFTVKQLFEPPFCKVTDLKKNKFTRKHLCRSITFNKVADRKSSQNSQESACLF